MNIQRLYGLFFLVFFFCCTGLCRLAWAVPAAPIEHELVQPDGAKFKAVQWGDEFRHGWETEDGYAISFDEQSRHWKYVTRDAAGKPAMLPERAGIDGPPIDLPRHSERNNLHADSQRFLRQSVSSPPRVVDPDTPGMLLVILVNFQNTSFTFTSTNFNNLLFGAGTYSMKDYYEEVSYGNFTVSPGPGGVVGWYTAANAHNYYGENIGGVDGDDRYPGTLVHEAVIAADVAGFNFAPYDQDGDGYVDQVAVVHQGTGEEASTDPYDIWSHSWSLNEAYSSGYSDYGEYLTNDGVKVDSYIIMPEIFLGGISTMGVFAHEYGHALGLPDLYDTDGSSEGVGNWSLMASGSWNYDSRQGDRPAHMDAWCKYALGWVTPTLVFSAQDNITIAPASDNDTVYQFLAGSPDAGGEYFLAENRQKTGFDVGLPGSGLLIWHVDESKTTNKSECEYGPGSFTCVSSHYHVALMQADGRWNLEKNTNRGDAGDPFPGTSNNRAFGYATSPSNRLWSGASSNVAISSISNSGPVMSFNFSNASTSSTTTSNPTTTTTSIGCIDADGDGFGVGPICAKEQDCDDADQDVNPEADEVCGDGIDNDCNAETPDDCEGKCFFVKALGPDNPRLETLRAFRDTTLAKTAFGRAIIRQYYHNSGLIYDAIERNPRLKSAVKVVLEAVIP